MRARVFHTMNEQLYYIMQWLKQAVPRKNKTWYSKVIKGNSSCRMWAEGLKDEKFQELSTDMKEAKFL